jgi:hypothetical protein
VPAFEITSPDGRKFRINAPEGTTREQALAYAQQNMPAADAPKVDKFTSTAKEDSSTQNFLASVGGAMYAPYLGIKQALGKATPEDVKEWKDSMAGLWSTPMGKAGAVAGGVATAAPLMMVPGANTTTGAALTGLAYGAAQPVGEGDSRAAQAVEGMGGGVAGKYLGQGIGAVASKLTDARTASLVAQQAQNAVRDSTLKAAQTAGYVLPPSQVSPTVTNRVLEGFAGKLTTAQQASTKNQSVTNRIVRKDLQLPEDAPLTFETMQAIRTEAAKVGYEPVRQFGKITADPDYARNLMEFAAKYDKSHGGMASLRNPEVEQILKDASRKEFDSQNVVELMRNLREQGFANKSFGTNARDKALGGAQIDIANAIENLTERNLAAAGMPDALNAFRDARKLMAKTFTAQKAINPATGNIDASKIGAMFKKDKPLSGGMREIGRTAAAFPAATKEITTSMPGLSPLDYVGGMLTGSAAGPAGLAATFSRPIVRSGILSGAYQKAMVNPQSYEMGLLGRGAKNLDKESTKRLLQALGISVPAEQ